MLDTALMGQHDAGNNSQAQSTAAGSFTDKWPEQLTCQ